MITYNLIIQYSCIVYYVIRTIIYHIISCLFLAMSGPGASQQHAYHINASIRTNS